MDVFPIPGGGEQRGALSSGVNWGIRPVPGSDGKIGRLEAIDLGKRKAVWTVRQRAPQTSGVLATAAASCSQRRSTDIFALTTRPTARSSGSNA
jgi:hypothetical protein